MNFEHHCYLFHNLFILGILFFCITRLYHLFYAKLINIIVF